jgi:hypothetical protein
VKKNSGIEHNKGIEQCSRRWNKKRRLKHTGNKNTKHKLKTNKRR